MQVCPSVSELYVCVYVQLKSVLTSIVDLHSDNVHNLRAIIRTAIEQNPLGKSIQYFHVPMHSKRGYHHFFKIKCKIYF